MKAFGMFLIVFGHVIGDPQNIYNLVSQPAFTKQIGVAFFVFITGWGLANNRREPLRAVYNRIFPFYFWGILFAAFLSVLFLIIKGDTNPSNYLPFFFGVNVFLDYFPANPTTWYIGTYLHLLLFWYIFLQGKKISASHIAAAFIVENFVRCFLLYINQDFVAYMLLPNWLTIFLLGMYSHEKRQQTSARTAGALLIVLAIFQLAWYQLTSLIGFGGAFPFRNMGSDSLIAIPIESILISVVYLVNTYLFFEIARRLPGHRYITYLASATLITVIIHMPIVFNTHKYFYSFFEDKFSAKLIFIFIIYFGTAIIANLIQKHANITPAREKAWSLLSEALMKYKRN